MSLDVLAHRLPMSLDAVAPPGHGTIPRHRTIAAALDWGFTLLSPQAQAALQAMSVFTGGCDLLAFTAVCHDDEEPTAVDVLDELVRTWFVTVDFTGALARYRLLEPVRQYAREILDNTGATADRRRRHLKHYLVVAKSVTRDIDQPGNDKRLDELRPELANFRAALDWAVTEPEATDAGLQLVARLSDVWTTDAHHAEGLS